MKLIIPFIISAAIVLASCRGAENKADPSGAGIETKTDSSTVAAPKDSAENTPPKSGQTRGISPSIEPNDILAKIDEHLVTSAQFTLSPTGGIINCIVTVTNTLPDVSFQKVMIEVKILKDTGQEVRTDYYTLINIEPGMSKVAKVPNTSQGSKVVTQVIKVKSSELTKGEWVMAGNHFVAK